MAEKMKYCFRIAIGFLLSAILISGCYLTGGNPGEKYPIASDNFPLLEVWNYQTANNILALTINNNNVFFGTGGDEGNLYKMDFVKKIVLWHDRLSGAGQNMQILVSDKLVFVTYANLLFAIDKDDGQILWNKSGLNTFVDRIIAYSNLHIIVLEVSESINAYDDAGNINWTFPIGRGNVSLFYESSTGLVYFFQGDRIVAINDKNGKIEWEKHFKSIGIALYKDGIMYYSLNNELFRNYLFAYDIKSNSPRWEIPLDNVIRGIYGIDDTLIVTTENSLAAINNNSGNKLWETPIQADLYSSPIIMHGTIFMRNTVANEIVAIQLINGNVIGSLDFGKPNGFLLILPEPSAVADLQEELVIISNRNKFYIYK
jgi:outer membrane protein assembly factor BamB